MTHERGREEGGTACSVPPSQGVAYPSFRKRAKGMWLAIVPVGTCLVAVWALLPFPFFANTMRRPHTASASEPVRNPGADAKDADHTARSDGPQDSPAAEGEERVLDYSESSCALRWLSTHQEDDGRWDCAKHGGDPHDVAVTALATLAFLVNGHTPEMGMYRVVLQGGASLSWGIGIERGTAPVGRSSVWGG